MELNVQVEKPSNIIRKLTIKVPAKVVANRFEKGLAEVQRTAKLKGFRPGQAPISMIKQFYGEDVRHQVFHNLIDESFQEAVRSEKLKAVGQPQIDTSAHQTGAGAHDHGVKEGDDLVFTATVEVLPEIEVKNYTGIAITTEKVSITQEQKDKVVASLLDSQAQLVPVGGGLAMADGTQSSRPVQKADFVDVAYSGGLVTEKGIEELPGMKGGRVIEVGSNSLIPGFEDELVGMRRGETKTFRIPFPADFYDKDMAGKSAEFTVTANEVKEKKLPTLDEEFAKQMGYAGVSDLHTKVEEFLTREKTEEIDRKMRSDLVQAIIDKNAFDVPQALIEGQTRALAQDWAEELKRQGLGEQMIRDAITQEMDSLRKRADSQVRASLLLEAIAKKESIDATPEQVTEEVKRIAQSMKVDEEKLNDYYAKNPGRKEDLVFRLRQEATLKFLVEKAKVKSK